MNDDITLSALVVLRPPRPAPDPRGSSGRADKHPATRETLKTATAFFARKGFTIGDVVGTSFWITCPSRRFEKLFGQSVEIQRHRNKVESVRLKDGSTEFDLSLLPDEIARHLLAVVFAEPLTSQR